MAPHSILAFNSSSTTASSPPSSSSITLLSAILRDAGLGLKSSKKLAALLAKAAEKIILALSTNSQQTRSSLNKTQNAKSVSLSCDGVAVSLDTTSYERMRVAYQHQDKKTFDEALFRLTLRYKSLQGSGARRMGSQAAVPRSAMQVLVEDFGVDTESFASPWNHACNGGQSAPRRFFSAFPDTDTHFGSCGNFLELDASGELAASFQGLEVNPPFYVEVSDAACRMCRDLLESAETNGRALTVVVVVPSRANEEGVRWCATSPFHVAELFFEPRRSSFIMATNCAAPSSGAGRAAAGARRRSSHPLSVFILQTQNGQVKWPCTVAKLQRLYKAFMADEKEEDEEEEEEEEDNKRKHVAKRQRVE